MGQEFTTDQVEIAKRALKKVLPHFDVEDIKLETNETVNDTMILSNYTFTYGRFVEQKIGILVEVFVPAPYRYMEPPDGDTVEIAVAKSFYEALGEIAASEARQTMENAIIDLFTPGDETHA